MAPSLLATAGGLLLLVSLSAAQTRGDSIGTCVPRDSFGTYCPTTCGVFDYLLGYVPPATDELERMQQELEKIANWTQGTEETIVDMKDSVVRAVKAADPDPSYKRSSSMLDDVLRYEKTIVSQEVLMFELQNLISSNERKMADLRQLASQLQQKCSEPCVDAVEIQPITGSDCQDVANKGGTTSGLYYVKPAQAPESFLVYCEIDNYGRGFTVLQRRRDGSVDFNRNWIQYKEGFGYLSPDDTTEFWLGNEKIHQLTISSNIPTVLRVELVDWDGSKRYADYAMFRLGSEADMYRLTYTHLMGGDAGDAFSGFDFQESFSDKTYTSLNGMQFSTPDRDNDNYHGHCAGQEGSGWWMNRCHAAHLNGKYYQGGTYSAKDAGEEGFDNGITWVTWHDRWYSLKETTMKIIPITRIAATGGQQAGVKDLPGI